VAYELFPSASRQGQYDSQVQLTSPASMIVVHAIVHPGDKQQQNSYSVQAFVSDDGEDWVFVGGGEHATLGPKFKKGENRQRQDPRLRIAFQSPLPTGTWVRAVCSVPNETRFGLEIETEADFQSPGNSGNNRK
jgi:hypothetical protein